MAQPSDFGRAIPVQATPLPELEFDTLDGRTADAALGKTETPVTVLPEMAFDMFVAGV